MESKGSLLHLRVPVTVSVQVRSACLCFLTMPIFTMRIFFSTSPNPKAGEPPLVVCPRLLIKYIRNYNPYWRPFIRKPSTRHVLVTGAHFSWVELSCLLNCFTKTIRKTEGRMPSTQTCLPLSDECGLLNVLDAKIPSVPTGWATKSFPV